MCACIIFSARRYIALTAKIVKFRTGSPKMVWNEQVFLRPKSHTGSKFCIISLRTLCTGRTVPCCHFSLRSQMAPQLTAKFRTASFRRFRSTLKKDSVTNYGPAIEFFNLLLCVLVYSIFLFYICLFSWALCMLLN